MKRGWAPLDALKSVSTQLFINFFFLPFRFSLFFGALEKLIEVLIQDEFETLYYILSGFNLTFEVGAIWGVGGTQIWFGQITINPEQSLETLT